MGIRTGSACSLTKIADILTTLQLHLELIETPILQIGNSKGLRLNKAILEEYNIKDKEEMFLEKGPIVLKTIKLPSHNRAAAFEEMHAHGDDEALLMIFLKMKIYRHVLDSIHNCSGKSRP